MTSANSISDEHNPQPALRDIQPTAPTELPPKLQYPRAVYLRERALPEVPFKAREVDLDSPSAISNEISACEELVACISEFSIFSGSPYLTGLQTYLLWLRSLHIDASAYQQAISGYRETWAAKPAHAVVNPARTIPAQPSFSESVVAATQKLVRTCDVVESCRMEIGNHLDTRISGLSQAVAGARVGVKEKRELGVDFMQERVDVLQFSVEKTALEFAKALMISRPEKVEVMQQHIPPPAPMLAVSESTAPPAMCGQKVMMPDQRAESPGLFVTP